MSVDSSMEVEVYVDNSTSLAYVICKIAWPTQEVMKVSPDYFVGS